MQLAGELLVIDQRRSGKPKVEDGLLEAEFPRFTSTRIVPRTDILLKQRNTLPSSGQAIDPRGWTVGLREQVEQLVRCAFSGQARRLGGVRVLSRSRDRRERHLVGASRKVHRDVGLVLRLRRKS